MTQTDIAAALQVFDRALAQDRAAEAPWRALQALTEAVVGVKLFTTMTVDEAKQTARREFTNDPVTYPTSGTKPIHYDSWYEIVHVQRRPFIANTIADIATVFPDHETIWSLGCGSVVNLPVEIGGALLGTVNMLHEEHYYTPDRVAQTVHLRLPAKAAFLAAARTTG